MVEANRAGLEDVNEEPCEREVEVREDMVGASEKAYGEVDVDDEVVDLGESDVDEAASTVKGASVASVVPDLVLGRGWARASPLSSCGVAMSLTMLVNRSAAKGLDWRKAGRWAHCHNGRVVVDSQSMMAL